MTIKSNMTPAWIAILIITGIIASCSDPKSEDASATTAVDVQVENSLKPEGSGYFSASGQIEADQLAHISTRMMGYITAVHVNIGDKVKKGQPLIDINNTDLEAKKSQAMSGVKQAESIFLNAQRDMERYEVLYEQKSASQKEFDDVQTQYNIAKAQLESARQGQREVEAMLSYSNISAPFNGVITSKSVNLGDMARPGQPLLSIEAPGNFVAISMVPESIIAHIHQQDSVKVIVKSNGTSLKGTISEISTSSQNSGGQYLVKIKLTIPKEITLYSGMFIAVEFPSDQLSNSRITVPKSAIVSKGELQGIYTVSSSNTALLRWLKLGREYGDQIEVLSGLSEGESYIVSAEGKLFNGVKLNIK